MWPFGKRREPAAAVDAAAARAFKAGQTIYIRKIFHVPGDDGRKLAAALQRIEAAGYRLEHQQHGGTGLQTYVQATFRLVPLRSDSPSAG
ncbi:hypothetical protein ACFV1L_10180 [Kitasatospora sp. NPDC059646]|uniref:hypothetical protein n=1 Tax=Kitasatospora sp. NPDC059646 TaxID=3346893 RepID=UPI0036B10E6B